MSKIRIGIVGYGNIGRGVEQAIKRNDGVGGSFYKKRSCVCQSCD